MHNWYSLKRVYKIFFIHKSSFMIETLYMLLDCGRYIEANRLVRLNQRFVKKPEEILTATPIVEDSAITTLPKCKTFVPAVLVVLAVLLGLVKKVNEQSMEIKRLKGEFCALKNRVSSLKSTVYTDRLLRTDKDTSFLTGLKTIRVFNKLHAIVAPYVTRKWRGFVSVPKKLRTLKSARNNWKLSSKSQLLMTLMKLRLGLLNKDLAIRFNISETLCSRIFCTWLRTLRLVLEKMVYIPDEETLIATKPQRFKKLSDLQSIIDFTEICIETAKDTHYQSNTCSDYKHHNTLKILVACTPNSSISFVSQAVIGRTTDTTFTLECG
ncbi:uncharacterized protein LOC127831795 [Dreissena polymorpha]|uniref:uncharacterized protein LOC127831795 n=1 Tax=Dreissena polymorpha TaxID=45954 RepID=UPI0022640A21|nr:uncharacterized protein LOC127831795 [Dreissena polymorpha]